MARTITIPENLRTKEFVQAFQDYLEHRKEGWPKEKWTMVAAQRKLSTLSKLGHEEALRWMNFTLDEGLKNIQEPFVRGFGKEGADDALSRGYRNAKKELGL